MQEILQRLLIDHCRLDVLIVAAAVAGQIAVPLLAGIVIGAIWKLMLNFDFGLANQILGLVIEGHCDQRGTDEYNRALGERRALAASEMLIDVYGIEQNRIKTVSYGEERPAVTGTGDAVWSKNRRDEFVPVYLKSN